MSKYSFELIEKVWDVVAEVWDKIPRTSPGRKIEKFHRAVENFIYNFIKRHSSNPRILDLGCGTGKVLNVLQKNNFNKLYGIDISSKMIEKTKRRVPGAILIKHDFRVRLPFSPRSFDFILITGNTLTSGGLEVPEIVLKNAYKTLKKNGFLIISCYNAEFMTKKFVKAYYEKMPKLFHSFLKFERFDEKTKTVYFGKILWSRWVTKDELKKLIKNGRFKKVSIHKRGIGLIAVAKKE